MCTLTSVDDRVATVILAEQDVLVAAILLKHVFYAQVVVDNHSICRRYESMTVGIA